jgi:hypothetical protein
MLTPIKRNLIISILIIILLLLFVLTLYLIFTDIQVSITEFIISITKI